MSIHLRYELGRLLRKCLLLLGFSLLQSRPNGLIQILQVGAFDGHGSLAQACGANSCFVERDYAIGATRRR